ncbi:PREDICTED: uncharacterized protein LOC104729681 [Camelina sativa]|uniref:Uncharacterized protein LOC104729681 n=1 Tax=Camelina sativa TaxID=90675 RepID=A0ABM1QQG9_CAMSA|nr:PREDICTED: uncharacterized protein LOC104729681 [Camelina sativa]
MASSRRRSFLPLLRALEHQSGRNPNMMTSKSITLYQPKTLLPLPASKTGWISSFYQPKFPLPASKTGLISSSVSFYQPKFPVKGFSSKSGNGSKEEDDGYKFNETPQETWFKLAKIYARRMVYVLVKKAFEKRKTSLMKFMTKYEEKKNRLLREAKGIEGIGVEVVEYSCFTQACRDFADLYTPIITWLVLGCVTVTTFGLGTYSDWKLQREVDKLWKLQEEANKLMSETSANILDSMYEMEKEYLKDLGELEEKFTKMLEEKFREILEEINREASKKPN